MERIIWSPEFDDNENKMGNPLTIAADIQNLPCEPDILTGGEKEEKKKKGFSVTYKDMGHPEGRIG